MSWFDLDDSTFASLFAARKPKALSDEAFALSRKWSQLAGRFGNIIAERDK